LPGLVGFVKPGSSPDAAQAFLSRMANALERDSRFRMALHHEQGVGLGRVALGFLDPPSSMVWSSDGSVCLVLEGEIYDQTALEQLLTDDRRNCPPVRNQAELVLRLYERFGEGFAARLNGAFLVAIWDRRSRTLALVNDRFGLFPLYYTRVKDDLLFASGVRALLADPGVDRSVDLVAVNQFLVYDHMLDDRTLLDSVRLFPQGSILTFRDGQLSIRPYWTLRYPEVYEPQPEAAYVEQLVHHLRQSV
jgi:asparagine synthase (glutamine-hydrolysing)